MNQLAIKHLIRREERARKKNKIFLKSHIETSIITLPVLLEKT